MFIKTGGILEKALNLENLVVDDHTLTHVKKFVDDSSDDSDNHPGSEESATESFSSDEKSDVTIDSADEVDVRDIIDFRRKAALI